MTTIGYATLQIIPSLRGGSSAIGKQMGDLSGVGKKAGGQIGDGIAAGITAKKASVDKASATVAKARDKEADAAGKVRVAEAQLQALRDKGVTDAGRLAAAEERVSSAKRKSVAAADAARSATDNLATAKKNLAAAEDDAGAKTSRFGTAMESLKGKAASLTPVLNKVGKAAAVGVAGVMTLALKKGFDRLNALDQAEAKLRGLGRSAADITSIMDSVNKSVKGTAFGLADAAESAATFSTVGVKSGADMDRVMKLLADTTAQAGSEFSEMTPIFSKIIAQGGLTTETFDQLNERATGVGEALSKHLGIPMDQVRDKAKGIKFEDFAAAMEKNIGGAAGKTGETFQGAWDNVMASIGRIGATVLKPLFEALPPVMEKVMDAFDGINKKLAPFAGWIKPIAVTVGVVAAGLLAVAAATKVWAIATGILNAVLAMNPITLIVIAIAALVAGIVYAYKQSETFRNIVQAAWEGIKTVVGAVWDWISGTLWPGLQSVFSTIGTIVTWLWQNVMLPAWNGIRAVISVWWAAVKIYFTAVIAIFRTIGTVVMWLWNNVFQPAWNGIKVVIGAAWAVIKTVISAISAGFRLIGTVVMWLWNNAIQPAWDGIKRAIEIAKDVIGITIDVIRGHFQAVADKATEIKDWIVEKFNAVVDFFRTAPGKIAEFAGKIFEPIRESARSVFNAIARLWNNTVGRLSFKAPDWVPGLGGKGFSVPKIPEMKTGGTIAGRRRDGELFGPGTGTSDSLLGVDANGIPLVRVSAGEGVVKEKAMDRGGNAVVAALNAGWVPSDEYLSTLPGLAAGGTIGREPYGLPPGTNTGGFGSGGDVFPEWVRKLGEQFNVKPSTYAGHQESDRNEAGYAPNPQGLNRGIDWVGTLADMQKFAEHLLGIAPEAKGLEQIIWQNPSTGQKIGWAGRSPDSSGSYFASDYAGHQDHVHIRASEDFTATAPDPDTAQEIIADEGSTPIETPESAAPDSPATPEESAVPEQKRMKSFRELGQDVGGIMADGIAETFGLPSWITDPGNALNVDEGDSVRTSDSGDSGTAPVETPQDAPATPDAPEAETAPELDAKDYAGWITKAAKDMKLPERAAVIGNATGLVESGDPMKMWANNAVPESLNYPHDAVGSDHDSVGLFQQRDNGAWGTVAQRMDPYESAKLFYNALVKVSGWEGMEEGAAAQAVQRSAFPDKYSLKVPKARDMVKATGLYDSGGWLNPGELAVNKLRRPEPVLHPDHWDAVVDQTDAVREFVGTGGRGGMQVTIYGQTTQEIVGELRREEWRGARGYGSRTR